MAAGLASLDEAGQLLRSHHGSWRSDSPHALFALPGPPRQQPPRQHAPSRGSKAPALATVVLSYRPNTP